MPITDPEEKYKIHPVELTEEQKEKNRKFAKAIGKVVSELADKDAGEVE